MGYQESFIGAVNGGGIPTKPINSTAINRRTGSLLGVGPHRRDSQGLWELDWLHLPSVASASQVGSAFAASSTSSFAQ